jgi:hypothetical protein
MKNIIKKCISFSKLYKFIANFPNTIFLKEIPNLFNLYSVIFLLIILFSPDLHINL